MWDKTLKKINHTTTPHHAAKLWNADDNSVILISNGINLVYRFEVNGLGKFLRMTHPNIRSYNESISAIDYQKHLFENAAPICKPVQSKSGNYIEEIIQDDLHFLAHVAEEVPGEIAHFEHEDAYFYQTWGQSLAKLHKAAKSYHPKANLHFKTWKDIWNENTTYLSAENAILKNKFNMMTEWLNTQNCTEINFGLTHGDHRPGNVLYDGKQVYIIDFDEPVYHWFIADIARPFLELSNRPFDEWKQKLDWFVHGYRSIYPINDKQLKDIHRFIQMKSIGIYLWCKNNWFEPTAPGGKPRNQWLEELEQIALK